MPNRLRRFLVVVISTMALFAIFTVGAHAYTYPSMPSDWQDVQVTIGYGDEAVTLPLARYPSGAYFSPEKHTMTVAEQKDYGFNVGYELDVKGWQCVGFARYVFTALFYKYPQDASIDTSLAYEYSGNYACRNMIEEVLGTRTLAPGYDAYTLKTLFTACQPGAVMRCGGHSMVLMAIYDDGCLIYDANFAEGNAVDVRAYTWSSFVERLGGRGIQALHMPAYYPGYSYSSGDNTYYYTEPEDSAQSTGAYQVASTTLNVRSKPDINSHIVGSLSLGDEVEVLGIYNGWAQISYYGRSCWVYAAYLSASPYVTVTFDAAGGEVSYNSATYTAGDYFGDLPVAYRDSRTFLGWTDGYSTYTSWSVVPAVQNLTLKAKWGILTFEDVPEDAWYAGYVETACDRGLITPGLTYAPGDLANRGQMITVLGREYEWETGMTIYSSGVSVFTDVPSWEFYAKYVAWANSTGITKGTSETTFGPEDNLTREQLAIFLYRLSNYTGHSVYVDETLYYRFNDWYNVNSYGVTAISWAVQVGLLKGDDQGNVNPQSYATRAEMITMLCRYMDYVSEYYAW